MTNVIAFGQRKLETDSVRSHADNIVSWCMHFTHHAEKADKGVNSARKVETAVFRYGCFLSHYMDGYACARLAIKTVMSDPAYLHRSAAADLSDAFDAIHDLLTGRAPWNALPNRERFKFNASKTLKLTMVELAGAEHLSRIMLGERSDERTSA